ncbi:MAG TPA: S8 family serine peptidase [Verrucomicrobiae bacterium]
MLFRRLGQKEVEVIRTTAGMEDDAVAVLKRRADIEFAALDTVQTRQFTPSDADVSVQWHHSSLGSFEAWERGLGSSNVTIAIVDYPFQMDHADLAANVGAGWDVTDEMPILTAAGDAHSTGAAGLAAAVIQNGLGVAGIGNFRVVPIGITGAISEMYQAVLWAADHNIRVVNISWTGGGEEVLQAAGEYLEERVQGLLVMPGLNGVGRLDLTNQANVICVSMTDAADNARSVSGPHIDFAAPGWDVYSTTTGNGYAIARGTSFSAPLFSGIAAAVMSINPALNAAQVLDVLRVTAIDKGSAGWDESFGWGRVHFGAAVDQTLKTLPKITTVTREASEFRVTVQSAFPLQLALESSDRAAGGEWTLVDERVATSVSTSFNDRPLTQAAFYRVRAESVQE